MVFSVVEATAMIGGRGFAKPSSFIVRVFPRNGLNLPDQINLPTVEGELEFRSDSVTMPGRGAMTTEMMTYGPPQKMAYESEWPPVEMTCICAPDLRERDFFLKWQDIAVGKIRQSDRPGAVGNNPITGGFNIGYYLEYAGTVVITQFDPTGFPTYRCTLIEAWPATVSGISLNWAEEDVTKILVSFAYRYYTDELLANPGPATSFAEPTGGLSTEPLK